MGQLHSQTIISGFVTNRHKELLSGASISLANRYDGTTSAADGSFTFRTSDTGRHKIICTMIGYRKWEEEVLLVPDSLLINLVQQEQVSEMDAVTVAAGTFEVSDRKRNTLLKQFSAKA